MTGHLVKRLHSGSLTEGDSGKIKRTKQDGSSTFSKTHYVPADSETADEE
ncbi:MAG: hypothetical protein R3A12_10060 [Ignavibacteria bacterium]